MHHQLTNEEHRLIRPIVEKWIRDLRSGEFGQTTGQLGQPVDGGGFSYCCLGLLGCQLANEKDFSFISQRAFLPTSEVLFYGPMSVQDRSYAEASNRLYEQAKKLFPKSNIEGKLNFLGLGVDQAFFSALNDVHHRTFAQIADVVEALAFARGVIPAFLSSGEKK
jgi:hypothetical protein